ncbi:MAG TPA: PP2C family protein-serine/threonine phosphatase [Clostridia bacterium]|nr:protein serine/threonine phosphatase 2C family protein [Clostridiaceae bacterium]HOF26477.1 PP2C family protein-serine/threonine phosphatase [Clostridia bacterium]HOM34063.1 PP2C family protein-serine/threonine phosphatase [Clostridia bacterium]HOR89642.1 PP2C family protein-serine/threonine phosphatase [Clostridia bacterium]HOT71403.1 PP2C family protein-serine/threonine phosphatase [Clostridia bacterium]
MLHVVAITDKGPSNEKNDDCILVNNTVITEGSFYGEYRSYLLASVFDGVGGEHYGDEAAKIAATGFSTLDVKDRLSEHVIVDRIKAVNRDILDAQRTDVYHSKMATTIAGVYISNDSFIAFNVGDSRVYRLRGEYMLQISKDHRYSEKVHTIYRYLGHPTDYLPYTDMFDNLFFDNDILVICTDGISDFVYNSVIKRELMKVEDNYSLTECAEEIMNTAIKEGCNDNLSIILIRKCEND